jgi:Zn-dependent M28 family amino/carboxypeptidase
MVPLLPAGAREKRTVLRNAREIIRHLAVDIGERTVCRHENLERARDYIADYFAGHGVNPVEERYEAGGRTVSNIIAEIPGAEIPDSIIMVGAHYDTVEGTPGADDNASGIAGLLEMFRLLSGSRFKRTARFVAFTLEEPPFFSTELMGSMVNAKNARGRNDRIELMVCLEMLGFASRRCPQDYPMNHKKKEFPACGNYISVISLPSSAEYVYLWRNVYNARARHKIYEYIGPASIPGMDLSDHMSFIRHGYPAIMLSDTGFYRNKNYHTTDDTFETINFKFLRNIIINSAAALGELLNRDRLV